MQKTDGQQAQNAHRKVRASTTLNRKYVKRPTKKSDGMVSIKKSPKISHFNYSSVKAAIKQQNSTKTNMEQPVPHPLQTTANTKMQARTKATANQIATSQPSAKELKDQAIKKALAAAESSDPQQQSAHIKNKRVNKMHFSFGRVMLALACTTAAVFAIVYFVNLNMPDISLRVAAMQTGINASYPGYVPRGYNITSITSEEGIIVLDFACSDPVGSFTLIEEKSSWDSNALLSNYVQPEWKDSYTVVREQGVTIYINGSNAAWVNGGITYKINTNSGTLTNKQIRSIAVSL
ncbi:hypothetical protein IKF02_04500 [Candidatus Saccharibacteria bacterium]|nr:hypothetical protein [Candidatus Saccharibacteria bacterium]